MSKDNKSRETVWVVEYFDNTPLDDKPRWIARCYTTDYTKACAEAWLCASTCPRPQMQIIRVRDANKRGDVGTFIDFREKTSEEKK